MKCFLLFALLMCSFASISQTENVKIVAYNVLNFPDGRDDCGTNTVVPNRADTLRKVLSYLQPDIFVACEIQSEAGADSILTRSLNANGISNYQSAQWHANGNGGDLNNQMYYNSDKLIFYSQDVIGTSSRDIDHYVLYLDDPNLTTFYDTTFIDVYMCHLKAGNGGSNVTTRAGQTQAFMDYLATQPTDHNVFFGGDFNVYTSNESGYQNLISGPLALQDPIDTPGSWNNSSSFAAVHTQSTRTSLNLDCGSKGGSDDRFDQILVSSNVMTGADSVQYIPNSYDAVGNDGNHFNTNLLNGANSMYPDSVINALYYMSDHLPVAMEVLVTYPTSNGLALYPTIQAPTCAGASDGVATINANQGQAPYSYQWDAAAGNATTATVTGLPGGTYCVQVTDNLGQIDNHCVFVPEPQTMTYSTFLVPETNNCDGIIYLSIGGGVPPYSYQWNDPLMQTTANATGLCAGAYEVIVTDGAGCQLIANITVQTASLAEMWMSDITIAPNPTTGTLNVSSTEAISQVQIVDLSGRMVKSQNASSSELTLNVVDLNEGTYFLLLKSNTYADRVARIRFIKE